MANHTYTVYFYTTEGTARITTTTTSAARAVANAKKTFYKRSEFAYFSLSNLQSINVYKGDRQVRTPSRKQVQLVHG